MKNYIPPSNIVIAQWRERANRRRKTLIQGGVSTYEVGTREGEPAIVCLCCGLGSLEEDKIQNKFCGFCGTHRERGNP